MPEQFAVRRNYSRGDQCLLRTQGQLIPPPVHRDAWRLAVPGLSWVRNGRGYAADGVSREDWQCLRGWVATRNAVWPRADSPEMPAPRPTAACRADRRRTSGVGSESLVRRGSRTGRPLIRPFSALNEALTGFPWTSEPECADQHPAIGTADGWCTDSLERCTPGGICRRHSPSRLGFTGLSALIPAPSAHPDQSKQPGGEQPQGGRERDGGRGQKKCLTPTVGPKAKSHDLPVIVNRSG